MDELELPPFPSFSGPVPQTWDVRTTRGRAAQRRHRLAVLNGACPQCIGGPGDRDYRDFLRELARPQPYAEWGSGREGQWLTPEGELAAFVHGQPEVDDRDAFEHWARTAFTAVGEAFAHVTTIEGSPWPRALLWFDVDDRLHLEAPSLDRYLHIECTLEHVWPPVFRGSRICAPLDERLDAPFRPHWPTPPAEASVFLGLHQ